VSLIASGRYIQRSFLAARNAIVTFIADGRPMSGRNVEIRIGALALELPLRNPTEGSAIAELVERELRRMPPFPVPSGALALEGLKVELPTMAPDASAGAIASVVVASVHRALAREIEAADRGVAARPSAPEAAAAPRPGRTALEGP
jgi:hypothetical protein